MDANHNPGSPECWDIAKPACLCRDTLADEHTYRGDKTVHEERMLGIEVPYLIFVPCVELQCTIGSLGSFRRRPRVAHFL
jgi:hypothetical protein